MDSGRAAETRAVFNPSAEDAHSDTDSAGKGYGYPDAYCDSDLHGDSDCGSANSHPYSHCDADRHGDSHRGSADSHSHSNSHSHPNSNCDSDAHSDSDCYNKWVVESPANGRGLSVGFTDRRIQL